MERLTYKDKGYAFGKEGRNVEEALSGSLCRREFEATAIVEKLAEYEDLEEQGRLIKLPCKMGDTVYIVQHNSNMVWDIFEGKVINLMQILQWFYYEVFGYTVFLTKEEAEAKLKEVQNG